MAERKPGPVKPPIIDLTARPVEAGARRVTPEQVADSVPESLTPDEAQAGMRADTAPDAMAAEPGSTEVPPEAWRPEEPPTPPPPFLDEQPEPASRPGRPWETIVIAAVAGALLGAALIYILASIVPLPTSGPAFADPAGELAETDRRLDDLEASGAAFADQATRTQVSLDATISQLDTGLAEVRKALDDAAASVPAPADLSSIETRLRAVSSRLDAVAAGASSADSEALAQSLTELQTALATITTRLEGLEQGRNATEGAVTALRGAVEDLQGRLTAEAEAGQQATATVNRAAQAEALGAAITGGRSFAAELGAVAEANPEAAIPADVEARAAAGLPNAETLAQRFAARVPDMLAARPIPASAGWQDQAMDWVKGVLAIRPAGEAEGEAPDAVMSRLEAAMARHDFTEAATLFAQLPPEMRAAAGDVATDVGAVAAANTFLAQLRATTPAGAAQ